MTEIRYNNQNVFSGINCPTPLFARSVEMVSFGERWAEIQRITLNGQLTGCDSYAGIVARQQQLLAGFAQNFKTLEVWETGAAVFSAPLVTITDISFGESTYARNLPFQMEFECYPSGHFSGSFGVLDPVDKVDFTEDDEGLVSVTHSVSARGFCTHSSTTNAVSNAKNWVAARTGWNSPVLPRFITGFTNSLCLKSVSERIDRLNATYEVNQTYISDIYGSGMAGVLRYTSDFQSGIEEGISTITIQGEVKGCRDDNQTGIRTRYNSFNAYNQAVNEFRKITNRTDLNRNPIVRSVSEDSTHKLLSFSYTYNDDLRPNIGAIYGFNFDYDYDADIIVCGVTANLFRRGAYMNNSWAELQAFAASLNLFPIAQVAYNEYVGSVAPHLAGFPLIDKFTTFGQTEDKHGLSITLSASYNNRPQPPFGLEDISYSLNFKPAIRQYAPNPILDGVGSYYIFDLGFVRRGELDIDLRAIGATAESVSKNVILSLQNEYLDGDRKALEQQTITAGTANNSKEYSIKAAYSAEQDEFTIP